MARPEKQEADNSRLAAEAEAREVLSVLASFDSLEHLVAVPEPGPMSGYTRELVPDDEALAVVVAALRKAEARGLRRVAEQADVNGCDSTASDLRSMAEALERVT